jgi:para-nitrobenzyl esterase
MKPGFRAAMIVAASFGLANAACAARRLQATIETGTLRGSEADGVLSFKGIPFAAPPIGPLRWRAPQPAAAWSGVRDASRYGHDCMQKIFPEDAAPLATTPAEDCLYANVWKAAGAKAKLPVLVWIYGGGFVNGGSSPPTYTGAELAKHGIMVVSFNYRLGRFGIFAHPRLSRADPDKGRLGNYNFMDQLAALQWVRRNIGAFGGDPHNVTIIGESAGGMSVNFLMTSPMARGLFQRAVVESGGDPVGMADQASLAAGEAKGLAFAASRSISADDPDSLEKLRALAPEEIVGDLNLSKISSNRDTFSYPFADGRIAVDAGPAYRSGRFSRVPVMIGATSNDIGGRTGYMAIGARRLSAEIAEHGVPVFYYRFSYVAEALPNRDRGAPHASDIPYFFDTVGIKYGNATTATDRGAGHAVSAYLVNFVKGGDPNGPGLPRWERYSRQSDAMIDFSAAGVSVPGPDPLGSELEAAGKISGTP